MHFLAYNPLIMSTEATSPNNSLWDTVVAAPRWVGRQGSRISHVLGTDMLPYLWGGLSYSRRLWKRSKFFVFSIRDPDYPFLRTMGRQIRVLPDSVCQASFRGACMIRLIQQTHRLSNTIRRLELPNYKTDLAAARALNSNSRVPLFLRVSWQCQLKPAATKLSIVALQTFKLLLQSFLWLNYSVDLYEAMRMGIEQIKEAQEEVWFNMRFIWAELARNGDKLADGLVEREAFFQKVLPGIDVGTGIKASSEALKSLHWTHQVAQKTIKAVQRTGVMNLWTKFCDLVS